MRYFSGLSGVVGARARASARLRLGAAILPAKALAGLALLLAAAGCSNYQFSVNEQVWYSPEPLFTAYQAPDKGLSECLQQTISDGGITAAAKLAALNCSHAGVASLEGLETFTGLEVLRLSNNAIRKLGPLASLAGLERLHLNGNKVKSLLPLRGINTLSYLNVANNPALVCAELVYFRALPELELVVPKHCR